MTEDNKAGDWNEVETEWRRQTNLIVSGGARVLPEIRQLIESARHVPQESKNIAS